MCLCLGVWNHLVSLRVFLDIGGVAFAVEGAQRPAVSEHVRSSLWSGWRQSAQILGDPCRRPIDHCGFTAVERVKEMQFVGVVASLTLRSRTRYSVVEYLRDH